MPPSLIDVPYVWVALAQPLSLLGGTKCARGGSTIMFNRNTIITQSVLPCLVGRNDMENGKPQTIIDRSRVINAVRFIRIIKLMRAARANEHGC